MSTIAKPRVKREKAASNARGGVLPRGSRTSRNPVDKAVAVLRWMVDDEAPDFGIREIARGMKLSPSTVHRVLSDLEACGFVKIDTKSHRYSFGLEFSRLAWRLTARFPLREIAMPVLHQLVKQSNETAFLGVFDREREQVMFIAAVESTHDLRYVIPTHVWTQLSLGSSTLSILAFLPPSERDGILDRIATSEAQRGHPVDLAKVEATLKKIRRTGFARTVGQRVPDVVGISAAVFDSRRNVVGTLGMSIPVSRFQSRPTDQYGAIVKEAANRVTTGLGGSAGRSIRSSVAF